MRNAIPIRQAAHAAERKVVKKALAKSRTRAEAARKLCVCRSQLYRICARLGIELEKRKHPAWAMHGM